MTIVSGPDHRNSEWANDSSSFGQKMLLKMGWKQGNGLGKNQQGTNSNLRAVRREENLGIGAKTDTLGEHGFSETSKNFHGVLASLQEAHGSSSDKSMKKDKKRRKKDKDKERLSGSSGSGITLSTKRVTAGHARKMREAKDLNKKSAEDMAAIFGVKVEDYQSNSVWGRLSSLSSGASSSASREEKKEDVSADIKTDKKERKKDKKKRKKKNGKERGDSDGGDRKRSKKSRRED